MERIFIHRVERFIYFSFYDKKLSETVYYVSVIVLYFSFPNLILKFHSAIINFMTLYMCFRTCLRHERGHTMSR